MNGSEIAQITAAYQATLVHLGIASIAEVMSIISRRGRNPQGAELDSMISEIGDAVFTLRGPSREIGVAYYRLIRALRIGSTTPDPREVSIAPVRLQTLREEFHELVILNTTDSVSGETSDASSHYDPSRHPGGDEEIEIELEFADDLQAELDELERLYLEEEDGEYERIEEEMRKIYEDAQQRRQEEYDREEKSARQQDEADASREDKTAAKAASEAEKSVIDASRGEVAERATRDRRAIGYARISLTGTPCGFCAMLISRGPAYRSERSATRGAGNSEYHPNCHCIAIPVYSMDEYNSDEIFALSRELNREWYQHGGTLRVFRRYIDKKNARARRSRSETAQEAIE